MNTTLEHVRAKEFSNLFNVQEKELADLVLNTIKSIDSSYRKPTLEEREEYIAHYLNLLNSDFIERNREENQQAWEKGWSENLALIEKNGIKEEYLKPKYFRGSKFLRYQKDIIVSDNPQIEHDLFKAARKHLFLKYLHKADTICELGCGSCQNLWMLSELFPEKQIRGFDWVKPCVEIANKIGTLAGKNVSGEVLDMLNPPEKSPIHQGSAIVSIHALEQIGNNHTKLIDFLIRSKPSIVLHYEPIVEFYDPDNLYDYMAIWYSKKRSYLQGFYNALKRKQEEGEIDIIEAHRPQLGGVLHEASIIAWKPKK